MFLLTDLDAVIGLVAGVVIALVLAYTVFFWLFRSVGRLDPSRAIRMALTVSLLGLVFCCCFINLLPDVPRELAFFSDFSLLPNFLIVIVPIVILLAAAWFSLPKELTR